MKQRAVTITAYALVPFDGDEEDYEELIGEILGALEDGLQRAGSQYVTPTCASGIPAEISDTL